MLTASNYSRAQTLHPVSAWSRHRCSRFLISMEVTGKKQITILPKCKIDLSNKKHVRFLIDHVINKIRENTPLEGCFLLIVMHNPGEIPPPFKDVYYPFNK